MCATLISRVLPLAPACVRISSKLKASCAQILEHWRQPMHFSTLTLGFPAACCSILPAREPPPMPRFFMQPPKPACS